MESSSGKHTSVSPEHKELGSERPSGASIVREPESHTRAKPPLRFRNMFEHRTPGWYRAEQLLGQGGFAQVWMAKVIKPREAPPKRYYTSDGTENTSEWKTGESVAVKLYKTKQLKDPWCIQLIETEVKILHKLHHPNILALHDAHQSHRGIHVVLEHAEGGTLHALVRKKKLLWESEMLSIFQELVQAISYMHSQAITHRDIKLENVMFASASRMTGVKLCDFGLAAQLTKSVQKQADSKQTTQISYVKKTSPATSEYDCLKSECGSLLYMAPEMQLKKFYDGRAIDVWSLGVLLYTTLTGHFPFMSNSTTELRRKVCKHDPPWTHYASRKVLKDALALRELRGRIIEKHGPVAYTRLLFKHTVLQVSKTSKCGYSDALYNRSKSINHKLKQGNEGWVRASTGLKDSSAPLKPVTPRKSTNSSTPGLHDSDDARNRNRYWVYLSLEALDLLMWMLEKIPKRRATIDDVASHPFTLGRKILPKSVLDAKSQEQEPKSLTELSIKERPEKARLPSKSSRQLGAIRKPGWHPTSPSPKKPSLSFSAESLIKADSYIEASEEEAKLMRAAGKVHKKKDSTETKTLSHKYRAVPLSSTKTTASQKKNGDADKKNAATSLDSKPTPHLRNLLETFEDSRISSDATCENRNVERCNPSENNFPISEEKKLEKKTEKKSTDVSVSNMDRMQCNSNSIKQLLLTCQIQLEDHKGTTGTTVGGNHWANLKLRSPPVGVAENHSSNREYPSRSVHGETPDGKNHEDSRKQILYANDDELSVKPILSYRNADDGLREEEAAKQPQFLKKLLWRKTRDRYSQGLTNSFSESNLPEYFKSGTTECGSTEDSDKVDHDQEAKSIPYLQVYAAEVNRPIESSHTDRPESAGEFIFHARIPTASCTRRMETISALSDDKEKEDSRLEPESYTMNIATESSDIVASCADKEDSDLDEQCTYTVVDGN